MKKNKRSGKIWIVIAFVSGFLLACGTLVYARSGFQLHERDYKNCEYCNELTLDEWDLIMHKIDGLNRINSN